MADDDRSPLHLILGWFVLPFAPLLLIAHHTWIFYLLLLAYTIFFVYINHFRMKYHWIDTVVFIGFFLFCALITKSLVDAGVINQKEFFKTAVVYGTME